MGKPTSILTTIFLCIFLNGSAQVLDTLSVTDLASMSLEELLSVKVATGNFSKIERRKLPVTVTVIEKDQIVTTNARNLAGLLEIYVPGLILMTHSEGDKIGLRGLIAAENYKLVLLVNGRNVTNLVYEGVITEIDMWDMNDILRVEVIRGPGSVTYGTGAMAGVINVITVDESASDEVEAGVAYDPTYRSRGGNVRLSKLINDGSVGAYFSFRDTEGQENPDYFRMNAGATGNVRYLGKYPESPTPPQAYLADGRSRPQIKGQWNLTKGNFNIWSRYTQSGQTHHFNPKTIITNSSGDSIGNDNKRHVSLRSFGLFPQYSLNVGKAKLRFDGMYHSQEYIRTDFRNTNYSIDHPNNARDYAFAQQRYQLKALLDWSINDLTQVVTGFEWSTIGINAPWGKTKDHLLVREGTYIISDSTTSVYYADPESQLQKSRGVQEVGNGISIHTFSYLFESNHTVNKYLSALVSARLDKPTYGNLMFSPRVAFFGETASKDFFRLVLQRSMRMMPLRAHYLLGVNDRLKESRDDSMYESINNIELGYSRVLGKSIFIKSVVFYSQENVIGFTGQDLQKLGLMSQGGMEVEWMYNTANTKIGFNHAYLIPLGFDLNEEFKDGTQKNNITFSDYYYLINPPRSVVPLELTSTGNNLNNWSNHSSRLFVSQDLIENRLGMHLNTRMFYGYEGSYDEMRMYENAYANTVIPADLEEEFAIQRADFERERNILESYDAYEFDFRINASVSYKMPVNDKIKARFIAYSDNMLGSNKRYYVSTGSSGTVPDRLQFMEEPTTIGGRLLISFE
ncbi:MAG: TonB-dependent receptor plug domain-containing protein [Cyclobacteriaceae bacterium]